MTTKPKEQIYTTPPPVAPYPEFLPLNDPNLPWERFDAHGGFAPVELENAFTYASWITNAVFWLVLGTLAGVLFNRFQPTAAG